MTMAGMSDDGFIQRWSKRKRSNRRGRAAPVAAIPEPLGDLDPHALDDLIEDEPNVGSVVPVISEPDTAPDMEQAEISPEELRAQAEEAGLTPVEDLEADSDFTGFLGQGVPAALTKAALRKLWLSDPVFANLDGLNDYDLDYNVIDKILDLAETGKDLGKLAEKVEDTDENPTGDLEPETQGQSVGQADMARDDPEIGGAHEAVQSQKNDNGNDDENEDDIQGA